MNRLKTTPFSITYLADNEVFVFGSNIQGMHIGGAAKSALKWGAVMGQGVGMQGQTYAIPTMDGSIDGITPYVNEFIEYAKKNPEYLFYVTRIGCGIAGYKDSDIAPLFESALDVENICLPKTFLDLLRTENG